jgi:hypothetical protein
MMKKQRTVAAMIGAISILVVLCLVSSGVVHAKAGSDQEWFGAEANGLGYFLGVSSGGGSYAGHIHTFISSSKCLDVPGQQFFVPGTISTVPTFGGNATGAVLQLWDCQPPDGAHGYDANQLWYQWDNGNGSWSFYVIDGPDRNNNTTFYCIDSVGGPTDRQAGPIFGNPVAVVVNPCSGVTSQAWTIGPQGQVQSVNYPGYCLEDPDRDGANGFQVFLGHCAYD